jgi:transcriptional regulator with XRE-family HTH domain
MSKKPKAKAPPAFIDVVRQAFDLRGLTQAELANKAGISQPVLSAYLAGKKIMRIDTLEKLAGPLGLTLAIDQK